MRALAFVDNELRLVDKPDPVPGPDEVVVRVERCGICGSDLHLASSGLLPPGAVMGHEFAGTVISAGPEVSDRRPGDRVAVLPTTRCDARSEATQSEAISTGACSACRAGRTALCAAQAGASIGLGMVDGAYAEFVRVRAASCFVLPPAVTPEQGALVEPYAVALHAVRRSRVSAASGSVAVIGAGPIGLLVLAALRHEGITDVTMAEPNTSRAALAEQLGAASVVDDARRIAAASEPPAVIFDCAGVPATTPIAVEVARPGAKVVLVGAVNPGEVLAMPGLLWLVKEVDVVPALGYETAEFGEAIDHVAAGVVDEQLLVSEVVPLERGNAAFAALRSAAGPVKVMFDPVL